MEQVLIQKDKGKKNKESRKEIKKNKKYISKAIRDEDLDQVVNEFQKISKIGGLTPENVVEAAKDKHNVLNRYFEWDDTKAGANWRKWQARFLIGSIKVRISGDAVQAFENVKVNITTNEREYVDVVTILSNKQYEDQILNTALNEIKYWQEKYRLLKKLNPVFDAIKSVEKEVSNE